MEAINCKCCGNTTKVMTIIDMMNKVDEYFKKNSLSKSFLDFIGLDYKDLSIKQNRTRLNLLLNQSIGNCSDEHRIIKNSLYPLSINFNEDFTKVEKINIETNFFLNHKIASHLNITVETRDEYLEGYLKQMLLIIDPKFNMILEELTVIEKVIMLKLPNERFDQKYAMNYYPNTKSPSITFDYYRENLDEFSISNIGNLSIKFDSYSGYYHENTNSIRLWLNQEVVYMYPDFGGVCFWFDPNGTAGGIESFEDCVSEDDQLYKDFESWYYSYCGNEKDFDWEEFNKEGKVLHNQLQDLVLADYIIVYSSSFGERSIGGY